MSEEVAVSAAPSEEPVVVGTKRRMSETSEQEQESKKTRLSPSKTSPLPTEGKAEETGEENAEGPRSQPSPDPKREEKKEPRRRPNIDDKQRSKRLFGALFGNNNAAGGDKVSRRRSEIEQRKKAELKKQDEERVEDRQKRLAKLAVHRRMEQINVDEQNLHTRHESMLDQAQHLKTRAEPQIFYRPWELSNEEEDRIADQVDDVRDLIKDELAEFEREKEIRLETIRNTTLPGTDKTTEARKHEEGPPAVPSDIPPTEIPNGVAIPNGENHDRDAMETDVPTPALDHPQQDDNPSAKTTANAEEPPSSTSNEPGGQNEPNPVDEKMDEAKIDHDDEADHMVEGDEDDVIY